MKSYSIFEVEAGKEDEGFKELVRRMLQYQVEGSRYQVEHVLTAEDGYPC